MSKVGRDIITGLKNAIAYAKGDRSKGRVHVVRVHDADARRARAAVRGLRALAKKLNLGRFDWREWKRYRDTGRR